MKPQTGGDFDKILELRGPPDEISFMAVGGSSRYYWIYQVREGDRVRNDIYVFGNNSDGDGYRLFRTSQPSEDGHPPS